MTRLTSIIILLVSTFSLFSQNCPCEEQLNYTIHYFEQNNPAFQKIKSDKQLHKIYLADVKKIKSELIRDKTKDNCIIYLEKYVSLLKDHHSSIGYHLIRKPLGSTEQIVNFKNSETYKSFRKLNIDTAALISKLQANNVNDIEGLYSDGRNTFFGIVADEHKPGNYLGIILKQNKLAEKGHILLELKELGDNNYFITYNIGIYGFNFDKIYKTQKIENGFIPGLGFRKITSTTEDAKIYSFSAIDANTNYLRLKSFSAQHTKELDNFYDSIIPAIKSKANLIIDLRDNGGGSEASYLKLLPLAYTNPLKTDSVDVWVSPQNISIYEKNHKDSALIQRMKSARPFSFIPQTKSTNNYWILDSATLFPKKIAVLFNQGTASAAEGFIYYLMQSKKVITLGQNSGGYIGYGDVMEHKIPDGDFTINSTTTKYYDKSKYEFIGIEPMYLLSVQQDWIESAKALLNNGSVSFK